MLFYFFCLRTSQLPFANIGGQILNNTKELRGKQWKRIQRATKLKVYPKKES